MDLTQFCKNNNIPVEKLGPIGEVSDGYHTFNSLYYQRMILFATIVNTYPDKAWKSHRHNDGEIPFGGGWFIVGIETPSGPYTYHYEDSEWGLFQCKELERAPEWDGHTDKDVERLLSLIVHEHPNGVFSFSGKEPWQPKSEKVIKHQQICEELNKLYERKNHDYGDSFHQTFVEEGLAMTRIRLGDKLSRFKTLSKLSCSDADQQQVTDESLRDTLMDLANYAIMTILEMEESEEQELVLYANSDPVVAIRRTDHE